MNNLQLNVSRFKVALPVLVILCISVTSLVFSIFESKLNQDSHHWGLMYSMAVDILGGLRPYLQSLNPYGILASPINILGLKIFGNHIVSLGIIYGILYSTSFIIIYFLLLKFLDKWLSVFSVLLIFLIHGHIIAPWPNYAYYAFLLLSLLLFTYSKKPFILFLSGLLMACSVLARSTSFIAALPPVFIYFLILYIGGKKFVARKDIIFFTTGLVLPLFVFLFYLISTSSFQSWSFQTFQLFSVRFFSIELKSQDTSFVKYPIFFFVLIKNIVRGLIFGDLRMKLYSFAFFNNLVITWVVLARLKKGKFGSEDSSLLLFCLISSFGYLTALHDYQIFRVQSSAALGIGVLIYSLNQLSGLASTRRTRVLAFIIPCSFLVASLSSNFQFVPQSSYFEPWNLNSILSGTLREPQNVEILEGKLFEEERANYYEEISHSLDEYSNQLKFVVNLTENSFIPFISSEYKRVQVAPFFALSTAESFRESEKARYEPILKNGQAILFGYEGYKFEQFYSGNTPGSTTEIPENYKVVKSIENPGGNGKLVVAVPKN
ncbi:MAG: hypothetical protein KME45_31215 [Stenomitos rutilans HA7619-LM2]|jgi:hypothetical protein|nr:hypothetical protein [Stenomitos rutilans HA7619-LM2]